MAKNFDSQGDTVCENCGGNNPVWFTDHEKWNVVHPGGGGILCPVCFIGLYEDLVGDVSVWHLTPASSGNKP